MPNSECFTYCPHIASCAEILTAASQVPSPSNRETIAAQIDDLKQAVAHVALGACEGPIVEERSIQKGGYFSSRRIVNRNVYVCGRDGFSQEMAFYYRTDLMPEA